MKIFLVANNSFLSSINYLDNISLEKKKGLRSLSIKGEMLAKEISKNDCLSDVEMIYSDTSVASISSAKYLADKQNIDINITSKLNDCKIGNLNGKTIKMLSYFQEHDFDYSLDDGESLNECGKRIASVISNILNNDYNSVCIFLPKRCILAFLIKYLKSSFNLDDNLILEKDEEVLFDSKSSNYDFFSLDFNDKKLNNIECINLKG